MKGRDLVWLIAGALGVAYLVTLLRPRPGATSAGPVTASFGPTPFVQTNPFADVGLSMTPRGVRNNNPGNLDYIPPPHAWNGQVGFDGRFGIYDSPANGVRAISKQLQKDYANGAQTLTALVNEWAPPSENDTGAYVLAVSSATGLPPDSPFDLPSNLPGIVTAIIQHENGEQPYSPDDIATWVYA